MAKLKRKTTPPPSKAAKRQQLMSPYDAINRLSASSFGHGESDNEESQPISYLPDSSANTKTRNKSNTFSLGVRVAPTTPSTATRVNASVAVDEDDEETGDEDEDLRPTAKLPSTSVRVSMRKTAGFSLPAWQTTPLTPYSEKKRRSAPLVINEDDEETTDEEEELQPTTKFPSASIKANAQKTTGFSLPTRRGEPPTPYSQKKRTSTCAIIDDNDDVTEGKESRLTSKFPDTRVSGKMGTKTSTSLPRVLRYPLMSYSSQTSKLALSAYSNDESSDDAGREKAASPDTSGLDKSGSPLRPKRNVYDAEAVAARETVDWRARPEDEDIASDDKHFDALANKRDLLLKLKGMVKHEVKYRASVAELYRAQALKYTSVTGWNMPMRKGVSKSPTLQAYFLYNKSGQYQQAIERLGNNLARLQRVGKVPGLLQVRQKCTMDDFRAMDWDQCIGELVELFEQVGSAIKALEQH